MTEITKEEFLRLTHTEEDCWLFSVPDVKHWFLKNEETGLLYYFNSDGDVMRFKRMEKDGEVISSEAQWGLWNVWEVLDDE